jgi:aminoglycoside phosphotransferase (APT) family kinase protein
LVLATGNDSFLPAEADFMRRDRALPGLATLLDARTLLARLRRSPQRGHLETVQITYVKYAPGSFCRIGYGLRAAGTKTELCATAYPPGTRWELQTSHFRAGKSGPLGVGRLRLDECAAVVSFFPNDAKIRALRALARPGARKRLLRGLLPVRTGIKPGELECLAYKPHRRYVARLRGTEGEDVALKLYSAEAYAAARAGSEAFAPRDVLWLPRLLGSLDRQGILAFEWLAGRALREALADPLFWPEVLRDVGAALAEVHVQEPAGLPRWTAEAQAAAVRRVAESFGFLYPERGGRARRLAERLGTVLTSWPLRSRALHGDFNATQVLLAGGRVALLDFDRAVRGDPALDLGNFLGRLEYDTLTGHLAPAQVERAGEALLEGYGAADDRLLPCRVKGYTAARLLESLDPLRYWAPHGRGTDAPACWLPHWPELAEALLDRVAALLGAAGCR